MTNDEIEATRPAFEAQIATRWGSGKPASNEFDRLWNGCYLTQWIDHNWHGWIAAKADTALIR